MIQSMLAADAVDIWVAVIESSPQFVAILLLLALGWFNRRRLSEMADRVTTVRAGPIEVGFDLEKISDAKPGTPIPEESLTALGRRIQRDSQVLDGKRVLWVDDQPQNNSRERSALRDLNISVTNAVSSEEAMDALGRDEFDVLVTDQVRGADQSAGTKLVTDLRRAGKQIPAIGYTGSVDSSLGTPPYFHAFVDRPDQLFHAIIDLLERQ